MYDECGHAQAFGDAGEEGLRLSPVGWPGPPCVSASMRWADSFSFVPVTLGLILMAQLGAVPMFSYAVVVGVPVGFRRVARAGLPVAHSHGVEAR